MPRRPLARTTLVSRCSQLSSAVLLATLLVGCATGDGSLSVRPPAGPDAACWVGDGSGDSFTTRVGDGQIGVVDQTPRLWLPSAEQPEKYRAADLVIEGRVVAAASDHGQSHVITSQSSDDGQRILAYASQYPDRGFGEPVEVRASNSQLLDAHLQILENGRLLLMLAERTTEGAGAIHVYLSSVPGRWAYRGKPYDGDIVVDRPTSIELAGGELLLAYRRADGDGQPMIRQRRSPDGAITWTSEDLIWPATDGLEPAGYLATGDGVSFIASLPTQVAGQVAVTRRLSTDAGVNWQTPETLMISNSLRLHGVVAANDDRASLLASRDGRRQPSRSFYLYEIETAAPAVGLSCRGDRRRVLFRDGFETGDTSTWSTDDDR